MVRSSRVLPWPRSPSSTTSCPASSARSSCGSTVDSKPRMPGHGSRPARSAASRFRGISSLTDFGAETPCSAERERAEGPGQVCGGCRGTRATLRRGHRAGASIAGGRRRPPRRVERTRRWVHLPQPTPRSSIGRPPLGDGGRGERSDGPMPTVAVTGSSGKLGRHVVAHLAEHGYRVIALDRAPDPDSAAAAFVRVDLTDTGQVLEALSGVDEVHNGLDAVVHLAAIPAPGARPAAPSPTTSPPPTTSSPRPGAPRSERRLGVQRDRPRAAVHRPTRAARPLHSGR